MLLRGLNELIDLINLAVFGLALFAFVDVAIRKAPAFPAVDKQTKQFWMIILGVSMAWFAIFGVIGAGLFLGIIGVIAVIVYLVDVRPALRTLGQGGGRGGPYGPW